AVAPMMDWTDRHFRHLMRLISRRALLYTEMVTTGAIIHGPRERLLAFDPVEHPVALQLGGSDPAELAACARIGADRGYDEINLNIGCPSDRVKRGRFGACLMAEPELVARCVAAMRAAVDIPVTVKCRIGIDDQDSEAALDHFVETVAAGGCETFIIHARKAWLKGLSPKQNRDVPPLDHDRVYRLKAARPDLNIIINGGIPDVAAVQTHLPHVDGAMLGRAVCADPLVLADVDGPLYGMAAIRPDRLTIVRQMLPYIERELGQGVRLPAITKHLLNLVQGLPGARAFRRHLSEHAARDGAGPELVEEALAIMDTARHDQALRAAG
ncbi:MAG: tRNA dihydrouridine(20/20a) synthase DusA, partial [Dichotomicrobium sp.]